MFNRYTGFIGSDRHYFGARWIAAQAIELVEARRLHSGSSNLSRNQTSRKYSSIGTDDGQLEFLSEDFI